MAQPPPAGASSTSITSPSIISTCRDVSTSMATADWSSGVAASLAEPESRGLGVETAEATEAAAPGDAAPRRPAALGPLPPESRWSGGDRPRCRAAVPRDWPLGPPAEPPAGKRLPPAISVEVYQEQYTKPTRLPQLRAVWE